MKAITRTSYGNAEVLRVQDIPLPTVKANEILVKVKYTTINRTDCGILTGQPFVIRLFTGLFKPASLVPGSDFAGDVVEVGTDVKTFKVGDRVWGLEDDGLGSQAEYMTISADKAVIPIPNNFSYKDAVACAEGGHYAYNFVNKVELKPTDKVLVNGATGAIGSAALQILKSKGIWVTAVGNTKNIDLVKSLGADKIYDFEKEDFTKVDQEKYQFVFDAVGKSEFAKCKPLLLPKGIYISSELGPNSENLYLPLTTKLKGGKRVVFPLPLDCKRSLLFLKDLMEKGQYKAVIDKVYQPEEVQEAYSYVASGQKTGSVLLQFA